MKHYPEHLINEAKALYVNKKFGCLRIQRELLKHPEARGLQQSTIGNWIKKGNWLRLREQVAKRTEEKFIEAAADENLKELKMIDSAIAYVLQDMQKRKVKSNLSNLAELIKLRMLKRGESTDRVTNEIDMLNLIQQAGKNRDKLWQQKLNSQKLNSKS
jgi:hypothetical protein